MQDPVVTSRQEPVTMSGQTEREGVGENLSDMDMARGLVEVMVFLFLIVPSAVLSFFVAKTGDMVLCLS